MFRLTAAQAGIPLTLLAGLAAGGWIAPWPAAIAAVLTVLGGICAAMVWTRDIAALSAALRRVAADGAAPTPDPVNLMLLSPMEDEVHRLARRLAAQSAAHGPHRRADTLILDRLPDPLLVLDSDMALRRSNEAARSAYGADIQAVLRHPELRAAIGRAIAGGTVSTADITLPVPVTRTVRATVVPMDKATGEQTMGSDGGCVVLLADRTRETMIERTRADFVANVSHELRTPLTSLIGFTETLLGPAADDPPARRRFLGIMAEQGARMNRLIDDLLSLSRIELTEHQPPAGTVDFTEMLPRLAAGFETRLTARHVTLETRIEPDVPAVTADPDQMEQVLRNLLDNALKYGRDNSTITFSLYHAAPGGRFPSRPGVVVAVADMGIGIPREQLPRLTERFYRVDRGRSRAAGGTGLGLAIVKHIVNRHRGQLLIDSEEGAGTTVSVWLAAPAVVAARGSNEA
jgi:two-component system phosphate regulon sensor histidine kinase PhoR